MTNHSTSQIHVTEDSSSINIEIILPPFDWLTPFREDNWRDGMRSITSIQQGGRLLLFDTIEVGNKEVDIMLSLHKGTDEDTYRIEGDFSDEFTDQPFKAHLQINDQHYEAVIVQDKVAFHNITIPAKLTSISIKLASAGI